MDYIAITTDDYLEHYGILGQKWGVRRYQNADGSLTEAGKKKLRINESNYERRYDQAISRQERRNSKLQKKLDNEYDEEKAKKLKDQLEFGKRYIEFNKDIKKLELKKLKDVYNNPDERTKEFIKEGKENSIRLLSSLGVTLGSMGLMAAGVLPFAAIAIPQGRDGEYTRVTPDEARKIADKNKVELAPVNIGSYLDDRAASSGSYSGYLRYTPVYNKKK